MSFPTIAEIRADAIRANIAAIRRRLPAGTPLCTAVKADAYGHGIEQVLPVLDGEGVERVAVACLPEALQIRALGWARPVLCLGSILTVENGQERIENARAALEAGIHCAITTMDEARLLSELTSAGRRRHNAGHSVARLEIKIDTGMGRMGISVRSAVDFITQVASLPGVSIEGVYTHFATADDCDPAFVQEQISNFAALRSALKAAGVQVRMYHAANSAAIFRHPETHLNMVRPGLAVYGLWGGPDGERPADLEPVLRVVGRLMAVRRLPPGHAVGYGCTFRTRRESVIGVVPIGYADGYRRTLSNNTVMTLEAVRGRPRRHVPVVGRVSMDQTTVDLTDAGDVQVGDPVVIVDDDPAAPNSVESLARKLETIPYEITCLIGNRVRRVRV